MEAPPDATIIRHTQGDQVRQRSRQQAKTTDVNRPGEQRIGRHIVEQQNGRWHIADKLRQANRGQP